MRAGKPPRSPRSPRRRLRAGVSASAPRRLGGLTEFGPVSKGKTAKETQAGVADSRNKGTTDKKKSGRLTADTVLLPRRGVLFAANSPELGVLGVLAVKLSRAAPPTRIAPLDTGCDCGWWKRANLFLPPRSPRSPRRRLRAGVSASAPRRLGGLTEFGPVSKGKTAKETQAGVANSRNKGATDKKKSGRLTADTVLLPRRGVCLRQTAQTWRSRSLGGKTISRTTTNQNRTHASARQVFGSWAPSKSTSKSGSIPGSNERMGRRGCRARGKRIDPDPAFDLDESRRQSLAGP